MTRIAQGPPADLLTRAEGSSTYARAILVDSYKQVGDPDDTLSWTRAVAAAIATGGKYILAQSPTYTCATPVNVTGLSGVTIAGLGMYSTTINVNGGGAAIDGFFYNTGALDGVTFRDFTVKGTVIDDLTGIIPRRSRTNSGGAGVNCAILMKADRPGRTGYGIVKDIRIERVRFWGTNSLPFLFDGVSGVAQANDVGTYLTMDGSWIFCEHVVFDGLRSRKSADNGFSISRSNKKVTGGSVHVDLCFDYGIFMSGFVVDSNNNDAGSTDFSIDTINVTNAGQGGVKLDDGPQNGRIGNIYVHTVYRGSSDIPTDSGGLGILIGGNPATPSRAATPAVFASAISVENALLINCNRGGVLISGGAKDITLGNITVFDAGSQFLADGTTVINTGNHDNNFGIAVAASFAASVSNIWCHDVRVVDRRGTPYTNYAIDLSTAATSGYTALTAVGCRVAVDSGIATETFSGVKTFKSRIASAGAVTGVFPGGSTASAASAAGNGANDMAGTVNITTLAAPPAGVLATITFSGTYAATPHVVITPTNILSAACQPYATHSATQIQICAGIAPAALAALQYDYFVIT